MTGAAVAGPQTATPGVPAGACDTHVHVFEPARFSLQPDRTYTPGLATHSDLAHFLDGHELERVVLVQPSVYGTDNACLLDALVRLGPARVRAIAVVDDEGPGETTLADMYAKGVRGIRLNIEVAGTTVAQCRERLRALAWLRQQPGWCLQLHASLPLILELTGDLADLGVPVVLDHFAGIHKQPQSSGPGWAPLLEFLQQGPGWVKLSAPYRAHPSWHDTQLMALAKALATAAPARMLWGSDWPHTGGEAGQPRDPARIEPFRTVDIPAILSALHTALGRDMFSRMLVGNPQTLYGFPTR